MRIYLTTTGTPASFTIDDLAGIEFIHPTTDYDLTKECTQEEINSALPELQDKISNGYFTLKDELGNNITTLPTDVVMSKTQYDKNDNGIVDIAEEGFDTESIHLNLSGEINSISQKSLLHKDDIFLIEDNKDDYNKKALTFKTLFDNHPHKDTNSIPIISFITDINILSDSPSNNGYVTGTYAINDSSTSENGNIYAVNNDEWFLISNSKHETVSIFPKYWYFNSSENKWKPHLVYTLFMYEKFSRAFDSTDSDYFSYYNSNSSFDFYYDTNREFLEYRPSAVGNKGLMYHSDFRITNFVYAFDFNFQSKTQNPSSNMTNDITENCDIIVRLFIKDENVDDHSDALSSGDFIGVGIDGTNGKIYVAHFTSYYIYDASTKVEYDFDFAENYWYRIVVWTYGTNVYVIFDGNEIIEYTQNTKRDWGNIRVAFRDDRMGVIRVDNVILGKMVDERDILTWTPEQSPLYTMPIDGLVASYYFNEDTQYNGTTGEVKDNTENNNDGTVVNGNIVNDDSNDPLIQKYANGWQDNDDRISIPDDTSINIADEISISCWVNLIDWSDSWVISKAQQYEIYFTDNSGTAHLNFRVRTAADNNTNNEYTYYVGADVSINTGEWLFIVVTYSTTDGTKLYLNNSLVKESTSSTGDLNTTTNSLILGASDDATWGYLKGKMDILRIHHHILTTDEIEYYYNNGNGLED